MGRVSLMVRAVWRWYLVGLVTLALLAILAVAHYPAALVIDAYMLPLPLRQHDPRILYPRRFTPTRVTDPRGRPQPRRAARPAAYDMASDGFGGRDALFASFGAEPASLMAES